MDEEAIFRQKVIEAFEQAEKSGEWDYPMPDAATDAQELTFVDWAYCMYKKRKPVLNAEAGVREAVFALDGRAVRLPPSFRKDSALTLGAAGDLMPVDGIETSADLLFEKIAGKLFDVDFAIANFEAPVTDHAFQGSVIGSRNSKTSTLLRCSRAQFDALARHEGRHFDALHFANNHTLDLGLEGLETTQRLFDERGILAIGTPRDPAAYGMADIVNVRGIRIGFVSATFGLNRSRLPATEGHRIHVSKLVSKHVEPDLELLRRQIADCKARSCDFIIASIHWGYEYEFFPRSRQVETAHRLVEDGVDMILGHHPHVIQPVEYYRTNRDPDRIAVIAYSLGGLTYDSWSPEPHVALALVLNVTLAKGHLRDASHTYIEDISVVPVFQDAFDRDGRQLLRIENLDGFSPDHVRSSTERFDAIVRYADLVLGNTRI